MRQSKFELEKVAKCKYMVTQNHTTTYWSGEGGSIVNETGMRIQFSINRMPTHFVK